MRLLPTILAISLLASLLLVPAVSASVDGEPQVIIPLVSPDLANNKITFGYQSCYYTVPNGLHDCVVTFVASVENYNDRPGGLTREHVKVCTSTCVDEWVPVPLPCSILPLNLAGASPAQAPSGTGYHGVTVHTCTTYTGPDDRTITFPGVWEDGHLYTDCSYDLGKTVPASCYGYPVA